MTTLVKRGTGFVALFVLAVTLSLFLLLLSSPSSNEAFVRVSVVHSAALGVLADVVGWLYFVAWSVSFYPQIYENWKRKRSVSQSVSQSVDLCVTN